VTVAQLASIYPSNADDSSGLSGDLKWSLASSNPDPRVGAASVTLGAVASICRHRVTRPAFGSVGLAPRMPRPLGADWSFERSESIKFATITPLPSTGIQCLPFKHAYLTRPQNTIYAHAQGWMPRKEPHQRAARF
jgi:hypothetical protein